MSGTAAANYANMRKEYADLRKGKKITDKATSQEKRLENRIVKEEERRINNAVTDDYQEMGELVKKTGIDASTLGGHLGIQELHGKIEYKREGVKQYYRKAKGRPEFPKHLSKMTSTERSRAVNELAKKPLADLRKRQDLVRAQQRKAFQGYIKAKSGAEKSRWETISDDLAAREGILFDAVDKIAFPEG